MSANVELNALDGTLLKLMIQKPSWLVVLPHGNTRLLVKSITFLSDPVL